MKRKKKQYNILVDTDRLGFTQFTLISVAVQALVLNFETRCGCEKPVSPDQQISTNNDRSSAVQSFARILIYNAICSPPPLQELVPSPL